MRKALILLFLIGAAMLVSPAVGQTSQAAGEKGAWFPGLSEYMAGNRQGEKKEFRKRTLLEYDALVHPGNEIPLKEYREDGTAAAQTVGRDKAALVFHQLKKLAGEQAFSRIAGELMARDPGRRGSWGDVEQLFEKETGTDLSWFFRQWIDRKGLLDLQLKNATTRRSGNRYEVDFDLVQNGDVYTLDVPVWITFLQGGSETDLVRIDEATKQVTLFVDQEPAGLTVDRDYDLPRRLLDDEKPPLLATLFGDAKPVIVPPAQSRERYTPFIEALKRRGGVERDSADIKDADLRSSSFAVMGGDNPLAVRLFGKAKAADGAVVFTARKNPWNHDSVVVIIEASSPDTADAATRVFEYGGYSSVSFSERKTDARTEDSDSGMETTLREPAAAIDLLTLKTLANAIEAASDKKIVYVGEYHDRFAHHEVELQVIQGLLQKSGKLAIGMEMFQRPFQKVLDDYIAGKIDEREFLKKSEYFKRWGFDYNLYKPILDFARDRSIPVVALNMKTEITDKVSKGGFDSLTPDEKKEIPQQMDFSDDDYRHRLKQIFKQHAGSGERSFDFFYQAQVLWDETMAMSVDEYMRKEPDRRMVVIAGAGHLAYGSGIPKRAHRRNGLPYFIVLNDGDADRDIADYLALPQPLDGLTAPKIMASLKVENKQVRITDLPEDSVSKRAGIEVGDIILAADGTKIESVEDLKLELFFKKKGDPIKIKVLRKRFLLRDKEMEFAVRL